MAKLTRKQLAEYLVQNQTKKAATQVAAYLVANGRSKEADLVVREAEAQFSKSGHTVAHVTSATELGIELRAKVEKLVTEKTKAKSVELINEIDPSLLGGVIVRTPEMEVDLSVRSRLNRLKRA